MVHHKPQVIETLLEKESKGELLTREQRDAGYQPEPFEFYVPYLYMRADAPDGLRSVFHSFVFIKASKARIRDIVFSDWNTKTRYRLYHYRNRAGDKLLISDREYQQLRDLIYNSQLNVFFGVPITPVREMQVGNRVLLKIKNWENHPGIIERIKLKKDRVSIRVSFNFLGQTKSVSFDDLHDGEVTFADAVTEQLITGDLVRNFEYEVAILLGHVFKKQKKALSDRDFSRLRRLYSYADIQIEDEDDRKRFTSLMLICASLLPDKEACERYQTQLQQWLPSPLFPLDSSLFTLNSSLSLDSSEPRRAVKARSTLDSSLFTLHSSLSYVDAYMMLALFVSTRDPRLRDAVKAYRKSHPDCPQILGTFINRVRDIRTVKR